MVVYMKKFIVYIIIILSVFSFTGCKSKYINKPEDGSIKEFEIRNKYKDGKYIVTGDYFDNDGKVAFLKITVNDGLIKKVKFDYIYKDSSFMSKKSSKEIEDIETITFHIKNLNSKTVQQQGIIPNEKDGEYSKITYDYITLLSALLKKAEQEDTEISTVTLNQTYSQTQESDNEGYESTLEVSYKNNVIKKVSFTQKDSNGDNKADNKDFIESYYKKYNISYKKHITKLEEMSIDSETLEAVIITEPNPLTSTYNLLASKINEKRIAFNPKDYSSLSSNK